MGRRRPSIWNKFKTMKPNKAFTMGCFAGAFYSGWAHQINGLESVSLGHGPYIIQTKKEPCIMVMYKLS